MLRILIHPQREITDDGPLKWVAGLYYFRLNSKYEPFGTFIGQPITRINTLQDRLSNESFAAYAQGIYEILPRTNLTLGLRYTTERRTIVGSITGLTTATGAVPGDAFRRNIPARRIALDHKFADNIMGLYLVEPPFQKRRLQFRGMDRSSEKIHGQGFRRQSVERGGSRICGHQQQGRGRLSAATNLWRLDQRAVLRGTGSISNAR